MPGMWIFKPYVLLAVCLGLLVWREWSRPAVVPSVRDIVVETPAPTPPAPPAPPVPTPRPLIPWAIPRTLTTTYGQTFKNVTIRSLTPDGGVVINYGVNAIKL